MIEISVRPAMHPASSGRDSNGGRTRRHVPDAPFFLARKAQTAAGGVSK
jgi:hypothetical protein